MKVVYCSINSSSKLLNVRLCDKFFYIMTYHNQVNSCNKFEMTLNFYVLKLYVLLSYLYRFFPYNIFFFWIYHYQYDWKKFYFNKTGNFLRDWYLISTQLILHYYNFIVVGSLWEQLHVIIDLSPASHRRSRSYPADWPWQGWNFENSECRVAGQVCLCEPDSCGPEFCDSVWLC